MRKLFRPILFLAPVAMILTLSTTSAEAGVFSRMRTWLRGERAGTTYQERVIVNDEVGVRRSYSYEPSVTGQGSYVRPHVSSSLLPKSDPRKQDGIQ